jgi:hypothetical protein
MHIRRSALAAVVVVASVAGCRPTLDGAWEGTSSCPQNQTYPTSMLVDENSDGEVEGTVFFENVPVLLFATTVVRADITDGAYDADKNEYEFEMQADDDTPVDFDITLEFGEEDENEATGDLRQFDNDGGVFQTCTVSLERLSIDN